MRFVCPISILIRKRLQYLQLNITSATSLLQEKELYAMFALQSLVHKLEHPKKLLHNILEILYDHEVLSDDGIFDWEKSENVDEQEGKGVAVAGCKQFLEWLRNADEEEDDDSP